MKANAPRKPSARGDRWGKGNRGRRWAFPPRIDRGGGGGGRHTHPCFGNALAWLAFYHDALEYGSHGSQRSVVLGGWGLDGAGERGLLSLQGLVLTLPGWTHLGRESTWDLLEEGRVE